MSAAEMREAAAAVCDRAMERYAARARDASASYLGREYDAARDTAEELSRAIRAIPLTDDEGMVESMAKAIASVYGLDDFAPFYEDARAALHAISGGKP